MQCRERGLDVKPPQTAARIIDKLVGELLEGECTNPTFLTEHPQLMSPLAKWCALLCSNLQELQSMMQESCWIVLPWPELAPRHTA